MTYATLRLCSGRAAFEAVPSPRLRLDLAKVRARLEADGVEVTDARVLLIARLEPEVTIARDGRILIKSAEASTAQRMFDRLRPIVEPA